MKTGIGQDSHAFATTADGRPLVLAGVVIPNGTPLIGNSDADVVMHAVTNAVSGITGVNVIGSVADEMLESHGITDSALYLLEALKHLQGFRITHISVSIECLVPKLANHIGAMRASLASIVGISLHDVGITATSGEGLTRFGAGEGIQAFAIVTAEHM